MKHQKAVLAGVILSVLGAGSAFAGTLGVSTLPELPIASIPLRLPSAIPAAPIRLPAVVPAMRLQLNPVVALEHLRRQVADKAAVAPALSRFFDNVAGIPLPSPGVVSRL
jgi:hypothetical protein